MRYFHLSAIFLSLMVFSCQEKVKTDSDASGHSSDEWSYAGETSPEHWAELEKNSDCSGRHQSPINIIDINVVEKQDDTARNTLFYSPKTILKKVRNNGHTIQFDFDLGDSICSSDTHYDLIQIHFHEPSEHTINGIRYPIETHLVHQSKEGDYTVLAIFGIEGEESETVEQLESFLPLDDGEEKVINKALDLTTIFPKSKDYYSYRGSLTTPPCTENVNWIIFKEPIILSLEEVIRMRDNMPLRNFRNEQPLNDRIVYLYRNPNGFPEN
jgi:carbonic anhydrase